MKRPRFRFGLRSLLMLVLIVAGYCGWVGNRNLRIKEQRNSIHVIKLNGAAVGFRSGATAAFWPQTSWRQLVWPMKPIDRVTNVSFKGVSDSFYVSIPGSNDYATFETDWSLASMLALQDPLQSFPELRYLEFSNIPLPRHGLACLENLSQLEILRLDNTQITNADLVHLKDLTNLRWFSLQGTRVDDECLVHLKHLRKLEVLLLGNTRIGDEGLNQLAEIPSLKELWIEDTQVTDAGMLHIANLPNLTHLRLMHSNLSDRGLRNLESLPYLKSLALSSDFISIEAVHCLKEKFPECFFSVYGKDGPLVVDPIPSP